MPPACNWWRCATRTAGQTSTTRCSATKSVAGTIKPLESRVLTRGHFALLVVGALGVLVVLCLAWGLYFVAGGLRRYLAARRRGRDGD
jgi:hypothetical protein